MPRTKSETAGTQDATIDAETPPPVDAPLAALWGAVLDAQRAIEPVSKDKIAKVKTKSGAEYTYRFASTEDMMAAARTALLGHGVMAQRVKFEVEIGPSGPEVWSTFRLVHPGSGQAETFDPIPMPIAGTGAADKVLAGALTYAWSYWLRDVLAIPREDGNEPDRRPSDDNAARYHRQRDEAPRESTRTVTPPNRAESDPGRTRATPPLVAQAAATPAPSSRPAKGTPEGDARSAMIQAAKQLIADAEARGVQVDVYALAGVAALGGKRWNANEPHTAAQYDKARKAFALQSSRLSATTDAPAPDDVPTICAACNKPDGQHDDGCPEAPAEREREPGEDDPDAA
jgi:hypothetical protein